jgi:hypothetical protein
MINKHNKNQNFNNSNTNNKKSEWKDKSNNRINTISYKDKKVSNSTEILENKIKNIKILYHKILEKVDSKN